MNQLIGQRIGNYQLEALLGEGGMGAVYRARDVHLNRVVALKVMNQRLARDPEFQRRFLQEAQAAARLKHPSIVQIYHFDNRQGLLYMAMAYVPGLTLGATMRRLAASKQVILLSESLALIAQVADALGYAHRQGVFHRDIKPDNVLLEPLDVPDREGDPPLRAVVTDFGLAKLREGGVETQTGMFLGTMPYMSPEQCRGRNIDGRSDIYSLGILLYQLVSGRLPFEVKTPADAAEKHIREMPPLPRTFRPDLPQEIEAIILKTLAKRPEERQQTGEELARDLRQAAAALSGEVLTQLAPATSITSLVTEIMSEPGQIPAPSLGSDLSLFADSDTLIIQQEGQEDQKQPLAKATIVIGRAQGNDIVLEAAGISRQHLRLERTTTGWQLIDLGSSNGTWVKGSKLLPNIPEPWELGQVVRIGPFMLRWQPATTTSPGTYPAPRSSAIMPPTSSGATQILTMDGQLGIVVDPTHIEVTPGETARVQLDLFNQGITVDHFHPEVEGIPAEWITIVQEPVQLMPDATVSLPFTIHPPRHSRAQAGRHRYHLRLFSQARKQSVGTIEGSVTIRPFTQYAIDAQPTQLQQGGICRVNVRNEGNAPSSYQVTGRDSAEALRFDGQQAALTVEPGQTAEIPLKIQAKTRPLIGRARPYPFQVEVTTTGREPQTRSGSLEVKPRIPAWVLTLIPILLALLCGGGLFGYQWYEGNLQTATAVALQAVVSQATAVAQTTQVALATQAANDDDGDGLSNTAEGAGGTDPQNPDTDGDGLLDGEEQVWGANPLVRDSDGDTLPDGQEVNELGSSPINPDTDGDGLPDNVDPDPGQLPTPTATLDLAATQTAVDAANATATAQAQNAANAATATTLALAQQTVIAQQTQEAVQAEATQTAVAAAATAQSVAATATAQARLVAHYPLQTDGQDITGKQSDMTLTNAPFIDEAVYCNGVYAQGNNNGTACVVSTENLNGFDFDAFSIEIEFKADSRRRMPVFVGGRSFRWLGFELNDDGSITLLYNNSNRTPCTVTYEANEWYTAVISYDGSEARLYLDRVFGCNAFFALNHNNDRDVSLINYSNATIFQGSVRDLRIYNEPIVPLNIFQPPVLIVTVVPPVISP